MSVKTKNAIAANAIAENPHELQRQAESVVPHPSHLQRVGRFRRRVDAEGHLKILKQLIPNVPFEIMFDITPEDTDSEDLTPPAPLPYKGMGERSTEE